MTVDFCPNFVSIDEDPGRWAADREAEGYRVISVADHISSPAPHPHVFVTATAFAMATTEVKVLTAFSNNLFRSPVEFAHALLMLQRVSGGRAEAGLGAGWAVEEIEGMGWDFPSPRDRAGRYIEAIQIARELLHTGSCTFTGEHYDIDIPAIGPLSDTPPPLVASAAGPRVLAGVAPHVDRIEIMGFSMNMNPDDPGDFVTRMMSYSTDDLRARVELANASAPGMPLGFLAMVNASEDPALEEQSTMMGDGLFAGFVGHPEKVAANLFALGDIGIHRAQVAGTSDSLSQLAPYLNA